ncbi:MAG TPA: hypothetical protein VMR34_00915 [Candidatus Saccharimonadales bacterium]|nr:hypothetical protein [Candidatus Saccharimonadales bacterium]
MPVIVNHSAPVFWTPANANGAAATVDSEIDSKPAKLNFYWSGMLLSTRGNSDQRLLREEVTTFLKSYIPKDSSENILHFEFDGESFKRIVDPKWVEGTPLSKS